MNIKTHMIKNFFSAFTLKRNVRYLFQRPIHNLPTIDGIRACSLLLVIACHLFFFAQFFIPNSHIEFNELSLWVKWLIRGDLGVDIFFVISGFLIGGILFREYKKTNKLAIITFFKRRFLRLTPVYWAVLGLTGLMFLEAPAKQVVQEITVTNNISNIWANVIYMNNFLNLKNMFMPHSWSLAVEEQFYLIFPFLCLLFFKTPLRKHPIKVIVAVTALYIGIRVALTAHFIDVFYNLTGKPFYEHIMNPMNIFGDVENNIAFTTKFEILYDNLYTKFIALFAGIVAAYHHVFKVKKITHFFSKGWISNSLCIMALGLVGTTFVGPFLMNQYWFLVYNTILYQIGFSVALAYFFLYTIYSTSRLNKPFKVFFGSKLLYPIAQLSYSAYLCHVMIVMIVYETLFKSEPTQSMTSLVVTGAPYVIGVTFIMSTILYVVIERPFMNLREKKEKDPEKQQTATKNPLESLPKRVKIT